MVRPVVVFLICALRCLHYACSVYDAESSLMLKNCPQDFVPAPNTFSCTCLASNVGNSSFSILWKDPEGSTVTQSYGGQTSLVLQFTSVAKRFNTQIFQCQLLQGPVFRKLTFTPKIAEVPSLPRLTNCPARLISSADRNASCTCTTADLGRPPALLAWENPAGVTVLMTQSLTSLVLPFTAVNNSYSGEDYSCVLAQTITGINFKIGYKPPLIVKPDDPRVSGVKERYILNQTVAVKCTVSGGVPHAARVDLHCTNHGDQPDEVEQDGSISSSLDFTAQSRDDKTTCTCQGDNDFTKTKQHVFVISVAMEAAAESIDTKDEVMISLSTIGAVAALIAIITAIIKFYKYVKRKKESNKRSLSWFNLPHKLDTREFALRQEQMQPEPSNRRLPNSLDLASVTAQRHSFPRIWDLDSET